MTDLQVFAKIIKSSIGKSPRVKVPNLFRRKAFVHTGIVYIEEAPQTMAIFIKLLTRDYTPGYCEQLLTFTIPGLYLLDDIKLAKQKTNTEYIPQLHSVSSLYNSRASNPVKYSLHLVNKTT